MHCEVVLISLARHYSEILGETDRELIELLEVMSYLPDSDAHPSDLLRRILSSGYPRRAAPFAGSSSASSGTRHTNVTSVAAILQFFQSSCHRGFPTK